MDGHNRFALLRHMARKLTPLCGTCKPLIRPDVRKFLTPSGSAKATRSITRVMHSAARLRRQSGLRLKTAHTESDVFSRDSFYASAQMGRKLKALLLFEGFHAFSCFGTRLIEKL